MNPDTIVLAGSAIGLIKPKSLRIAGDVQAGDAIVMLASSGVQTNGLTLCRALAQLLPDGYLSMLPDGRTYGEALLAPSAIYVNFVAECQRAKLPIRYAVHVTGHGWRKLMRLEAPFVYRITEPGPIPPLFAFIAEQGKIEIREMYATFNMGAGFAVYVPPEFAVTCVGIARSTGHDAWIAGTIEQEGERRAVEIVPLQICFESDTLQVR